MGATKVAYPSAGEGEDTGLEAWDRAPLSGLAGWQPAWGDAGGIRSQEVRWIFPGRLTAAMANWFERFPAETITLEDVYLVDPHLAGLSVKLRQGRALEVKTYCGSRGLLEVPGRALGRLQAWQKWSFPCGPVAEGALDRATAGPAGWRTVRKRRRICRFSPARWSDGADAAAPGVEPRCAVELAEFRALGEDWWTLAFEATGPADVLRGRLSASAALVFGQAMPGERELDVNDSMSYSEWLRGQPGHHQVPEQRGGGAR